MDIKVIKNVDEINKLLDLFMKVFLEPPYEEKWTKKLVFQRLSEIYNQGKEFCLYAEIEGNVVGLIFCQKQTWEDGIHLIIEDTVVDPSYRGKGVGAKLVKHLEEIAKKKGIVSLDGLVNEKASANIFWSKQGFKPNGYVQFVKKIY